MAELRINYILIDGSYYCFYRYYSLITWWKNAHKDELLESPFENEIFLDKFKKLYVENIFKLSKKLNISKNEPVKILIAKDCPRMDIWRMQIYNEYKATRKSHDAEDIPHFFETAYRELIPPEVQVLSHPHLEADDCIALYVKHLRSIDSQSNIFIVASDTDYLQLAYDANVNTNNNLKIYNLAFKNLEEQKSAKNCNLFSKILMGDTSDNIKGIIKKCGIKTAQKYDTNPELFAQLLASSDEIRNNYELNRTLMDFNCVPRNLIEEFIRMNVECDL